MNSTSQHTANDPSLTSKKPSEQAPAEQALTRLAANTSAAMLGGAAGFLAFGPVGALGGVALGATGAWALRHLPDAVHSSK